MCGCSYAAACGVPVESAPDFMYPDPVPTPAATTDPQLRLSLTSRTAAITSMRQSILAWIGTLPSPRGSAGSNRGSTLPPLLHAEEVAAATERHKWFYYQVSLPHYRDPSFQDAAVGRCGAAATLPCVMSAQHETRCRCPRCSGAAELALPNWHCRNGAADVALLPTCAESLMLVCPMWMSVRWMPRAQFPRLSHVRCRHAAAPDARALQVSAGVALPGQWAVRPALRLHWHFDHIRMTAHMRASPAQGTGHSRAQPPP